MALARIILVFFSFIVCCWSLPNGAPTSACTTLTPLHSGIPAQEDAAPYTLLAVKSGDKIRVTLSSPIGEKFHGFVLQARSSKNRAQLVDGTFRRSNVAKTIDCSNLKSTDCLNVKQNTLTHVSPEEKTEVRTEWTPASHLPQEVVFRATVVKTYDEFWTEIDSSPVSIQSSGFSCPNRHRFKRDSSSIYDGCYETTGCFGLPLDCITRKDCEVLLSYSVDSGGIKFRMQGYLDSRVYMAMGLSDDGIMGDDSVIECYNENSEVFARRSFNYRKNNTLTARLSRGDYDGSFANGLTTCSWTYMFVTQMYGKRYDLENNKYYILLSKGRIDDNGKLTYHDSRIASHNSVNFTSVEATDEADVITTETHDETEESTLLNTEATVSSASKYSPNYEDSKETIGEHNKGENSSSDSLRLSFNLVLFIVLQLIFYASRRNLLLKI